MPAGKLRPPYAQRIIRYCESRCIDVPRAFNMRSAYRFAIIDLSESLPKLFPITDWDERWVIGFLDHPSRKGLLFQVLDFKHGFEMRHVGLKKLERGVRFAHEVPGELKYLVE